MALKIKSDTTTSKIRDITTVIAHTARSLLDLSTKAAGCGINPDKSEVLLPTEYRNLGIDSKTDFTWLGYSLKLTKTCHLVFTEEKMTTRFKHSLGMARNIFQYIKSVFVRWRVFKV